MRQILLVEDNADQRDNLQLILKKAFAKHEIVAVGSLGEAKTKIKELWAVNLIVTDYQLLDGNAYELLKYCQEHLTNVPVIIITAFGQDEEKEVRAALSFQKGAFDFMHKPLEPEELIERIKHALQVAEDLA